MSALGISAITFGVVFFFIFLIILGIIINNKIIYKVHDAKAPKDNEITASGVIVKHRISKLCILLYFFSPANFTRPLMSVSHYAWIEIPSIEKPLLTLTTGYHSTGETVTVAYNPSKPYKCRVLLEHKVLGAK